jgi:hypothetical protein
MEIAEREVLKQVRTWAWIMPKDGYIEDMVISIANRVIEKFLDGGPDGIEQWEALCLEIDPIIEECLREATELCTAEPEATNA